jgi:nickel-dependent lactate racemase
MGFGLGFVDRVLTMDETGDMFQRGVEDLAPDGKRIVVIIPDGTRSSPMPLVFRQLADRLLPRAKRLDFAIALGTHLPMSEPAILEHLGLTAEERHRRYRDVGIFNHDWTSGLERIGTVGADEMTRLSGGLWCQEMPVTLSRRVLDCDHLVIVGPVFPHEVVGYSGGNKYLFPGVSGPQVINATHWLAGLIGNIHIIGHQDTPVRRLLDAAASFVSCQKSCFSMVVRGANELMGLYYGTPEESQAAAARLSASVNVRYVERQYQTVLAVLPKLYDDFWTGCKGMLKSEPVVADGGTLIIYAPHITEVSYTHGETLLRLGYHLRDYYLAHWDQVTERDMVALGHAALTRGVGTWRDGVEHLRVNLELATGIPEAVCRQINLGYRDPATICVDEWKGREDEGTLVIPRAGEQLYMVRQAPAGS